MRGNASAEKREASPRSLMQRLALVAGGVLSGADEKTSPPQPPYQPSLLGYFGISLVSAGMAGGVALIALQIVAPGYVRIPEQWRVSPAIAALAPWAFGPSAALSTVAVADAQPDAFDMIIDRSERASAPFGLRLVGAGDADFEIIVRDVPPSTVLSHGERRDEFTWSLKATDLRDLQLTMNDGTPDAFDVRIDVVGPADVAAASAIARVRLVDVPGKERMVSLTSVNALADPVPPPASVASIDTPFQTHTTVSSRNRGVAGKEKTVRAAPPQPAAVVSTAAARPPQAAAQPEDRHWPEGASALGAIPRESDRQMWWKLPALTWSPFPDTASRP